MPGPEPGTSALNVRVRCQAMPQTNHLCACVQPRITYSWTCLVLEHQNMVVPGDICCIKAGDQLPADLRVIEAANLRVAEDALTGESNPVAKHIRPIPGGKGIGM
jgi:P-type E1-E2 ATPase